MADLGTVNNHRIGKCSLVEKIILSNIKSTVLNDIFKEQNFKSISAKATDDNLFKLSDAVKDFSSGSY
ncbi:hypothetical protein ACH36K_12070 [Clostridium sp. MB05]|uniref:hypothetical protein n=1 Tax=Clostridium sp. MB05 TaxID=3376682 RepID=UPI0039826B5B